jgi:hypothetical protein
MELLRGLPYEIAWDLPAMMSNETGLCHFYSRDLECFARFQQVRPVVLNIDKCVATAGS